MTLVGSKTPFVIWALTGTPREIDPVTSRKNLNGITGLEEALIKKRPRDLGEDRLYFKVSMDGIKDFLDIDLKRPRRRPGQGRMQNNVVFAVKSQIIT
jgi:hypothetical protein